MGETRDSPTRAKLPPVIRADLIELDQVFLVELSCFARSDGVSFSVGEKICGVSAEPGRFFICVRGLFWGARADCCEWTGYGATEGVVVFIVCSGVRIFPFRVGSGGEDFL